MRENRLSGSEGGGTKSIDSSYPYRLQWQRPLTIHYHFRPHPRAWLKLTPAPWGPRPRLYAAACCRRLKKVSCCTSKLNLQKKNEK